MCKKSTLFVVVVVVVGIGRKNISRHICNKKVVEVIYIVLTIH